MTRDFAADLAEVSWRMTWDLCINFAVFSILHMTWYLQSNDKLMPNSCLGQNLLVDHHGITVLRNSCLSHAQILKHHGIADV